MHGDGDLLAFPIAAKLGPAVDDALKQRTRSKTSAVAGPNPVDPAELEGTYDCGSYSYVVYRNTSTSDLQLNYFDEDYKVPRDIKILAWRLFVSFPIR